MLIMAPSGAPTVVSPPEATPIYATNAPASDPPGDDSGKSNGGGAGQAAGAQNALGTNVLSDNMKFGKLLNRVRFDGRVYLNYKELKQCLGDHRLFVEKLKREIRYIDTYYSREEKLLVAKPEQGAADVFGLLRFVVLNVLAALKLMVKKDKWLGGETTCRPDVLPYLEESAVYNSLRCSPVFLRPPSDAGAKEGAGAAASTTAVQCVGCGVPTYYPAQPHSCTHAFCWNCIFARQDKKVQVCPVCTEPLVIGSATILLEEVLGVEPKVAPRRERRRREKKDAAASGGDDDAAAAGGGSANGEAKETAAATPTTANILTESDDEKAQQRFQYYCTDCSMVLNSFRQAQIHSNGQRHLDQVQRLKERSQREGTTYESAGVVEYTDAVKVEGMPKPRRSRGGAKNRLKQQRFEEQQKMLLTQQQQLEQMQRRLLTQQQVYENTLSLSSLYSNPAGGGTGALYNNGGYSAFNDTSGLQNGAYYGAAVANGGAAGGAPSTGGSGVPPLQQVPSFQQMPSLQQMPSSNAVPTGAQSSRSSTHSPYGSAPYGDPQSPSASHVSGGHSQHGSGIFHHGQRRSTSAFNGSSFAPHLVRVDSQLSHGAGAPPNHAPPMHMDASRYVDVGRSMSEYEPSVSDTTGAPSLCASSLLHSDKTHAFQSDRMNTVLRQAIELVIQKKDVERSLKRVKQVMVEQDGCELLVDEIFRGVFNGENTIEYAHLCRMLIDAPEPEVSLSIHEFCHLLLQRCRLSVTTAIVSAKTTYDMPQEQIDSLEEQELRARFRRVSSIKFSADLYGKGILPEALVHLCIQTMLFGKPGMPTEDSEVSAFDEDALATVCRIFAAVGEKLRDTNPTTVGGYCTALERALGNISSSRVRRKVQAIITQYRPTPEAVAADATKPTA